MTDDLELEELLRAGLERRAASADVTAPVVVRARAAVRRRRRGTVGVVAAAASVAVVATLGVVADRDDSSAPADDRIVEPMPTEWRTEYWRDLKVDVPADWGWGGGPIREGDHQFACYPEAVVTPDGGPEKSDPTRGYVGRPIFLTDVCMSYPDNRPDRPRAPYVWLGTDIEPGTVELGGGYIQETVEVNGSTLTVATADPELRERIIDSAGGGEQCLSELETPPSRSIDEDFGSAASGILVCAYRENPDGIIGLTYATTIGHAAAREFQAAFQNAKKSPVGRGCDLGVDSNWVVLLVQDRTYIVYPEGKGCPRVEAVGVPGERPVVLSPALVRPWAIGGVPAVVAADAGPGDAWVYDYFIGPQG